MARPSFRERMAFRTGRILERVGDSATLEDGSKVLGVFSNPALDPQLGSKRMARGVDAAELISGLAGQAGAVTKGPSVTASSTAMFA